MIYFEVSEVMESVWENKLAEKKISTTEKRCRAKNTKRFTENNMPLRRYRKPNSKFENSIPKSRDENSLSKQETRNEKLHIDVIHELVIPSAHIFFVGTLVEGGFYGIVVTREGLENSCEVVAVYFYGYFHFCGVGNGSNVRA